MGIIVPALPVAPGGGRPVVALAGEGDATGGAVEVGGLEESTLRIPTTGVRFTVGF